MRKLIFLVAIVAIALTAYSKVEKFGRVSTKLVESYNGDLRVDATANKVIIDGETGVDLQIAGANEVILDGTGLGVGVTPASKLDVLGDGTAGHVAQVKGGGGLPVTTGAVQTDGNFRMRGEAGNVIDFGCHNLGTFPCWIQAADQAALGTEFPLLLNPNGGNIGIGILNPGHALSIQRSGVDALVDITMTSNTTHDLGVRTNGFGSRGSFMGFHNDNATARCEATGSDTWLDLVTNSVIRVRMTSAGNTGVGPDAPLSHFSVETDTASSVVQTTFSNKNATINAGHEMIRVQTLGDSDTTGSKMMTFLDTSLIGSISVASATSIAFNTTSDARLKENWRDIPTPCKTLMKIKFRRFEWKEDGHTSDGVIAQELKEVYPEPVMGDDLSDPKENPMQVDYSKLVSLIGACEQKRLRKQESLEARLAKLEGVNPEPKLPVYTNKDYANYSYEQIGEARKCKTRKACREKIRKTPCVEGVAFRQKEKKLGIKTGNFEIICRKKI